MKPLAYSTAKIGADKRGCPRVWLEGRRLEQSGFQPAARYQVSFDEEQKQITLCLAPDGERSVSRRAKGENETPVIDLANARLLAAFTGIETLRVVFSEGRIVITPTASDLRKVERAARLRRRLNEKLPLRTGSVSTGLGVLALAIHRGLAAAGLESSLEFSVEISDRYQDHCVTSNPVWNDQTLAINMAMQEVAFDATALHALPQVEILEAGIPCTAHSIAGRAKKALERPEDDPVAGHLVAGFLAIVAACNPSAVIVENVVQYAESASHAILSNQLKEWGYTVRSTVLRGADFGCIEHRDRMALVAVTPGVDLDLETLAPIEPEQHVLAEYLDEIAPNDPCWSPMSYLREKEEKDIAAGKGFRMQIFTQASPRIATLTRGYSRVRSTDPKLQHPTNPSLLRQITPAEHARIKGLPAEMVRGLPQTTAHEMLGQSILMAPFQALAERLGGAIGAWHEGRPAPKGEPRPARALPVEELPLFAAA